MKTSLRLPNIAVQKQGILSEEFTKMKKVDGG